MRTNKQKILSRAEGTITIDIPPIQLPTPVKAARWCVTNPVMQALFFMAIGVGIGHGWHSTLPKVSPAPVITVTETGSTGTLADFVARESQGLTASERQKLIAVTETILRGHFDTPSEMREAFRYERRKARIESLAFNAFNDKWTAKIEGMAEESVEAMRLIYESLLRGLSPAVSYFGEPATLEPATPEPVEGCILPSNVTPIVSGGDVPVSPNVLGGMVDESAESLPTVRRPPSLQRRR